MNRNITAMSNMKIQFDIDRELKKASAYHESGQLQRAEKIYSKILQIDPNHSTSIFALGIIAHQIGRNDLAGDLINRAVQIDPKNGSTLFPLYGVIDYLTFQNT